MEEVKKEVNNQKRIVGSLLNEVKTLRQDKTSLKEALHTLTSKWCEHIRKRQKNSMWPHKEKRQRIPSCFRPCTHHNPLINSNKESCLSLTQTKELASHHFKQRKMTSQHNKKIEQKCLYKCSKCTIFCSIKFEELLSPINRATPLKTLCLDEILKQDIVVIPKTYRFYHLFPSTNPYLPWVYLI